MPIVPSLSQGATQQTLFLTHRFPPIMKNTDNEKYSTAEAEKACGTSRGQELTPSAHVCLVEVTTDA